MSYIGRTTFALAMFIFLLIGLSLFLPTTRTVEGEVFIDADMELIFEQINDLRNWDLWFSPLQNESVSDEDLFSDLSSGLDATVKWGMHRNQFAGHVLTVKQSDPLRVVETKMDSEEGQYSMLWKLEQVGKSVKVTCREELDFGFDPIAKFYWFFWEDKLPFETEGSLEGLKAFSEDQPRIKQVVVSEEYIGNKKWFLSIRDTILQREMGNIHGELYTEISRYMDVNGIVSDAPPLMVYHYWSDSIVDLEAGIPVFDSIVVSSPRVRLNFIDTGKIIMATHRGPYERLPETYFGINEWIRENACRVTGAPWEVYKTDPAEEPNPENWETEVYFPIKM